MIPVFRLNQATAQIRGRLEVTPLTWDEREELYLKWENHQVTGSFKVRGAINKVYALKPEERERGLVAASAGNHGQGLAWAARKVRAKVTVFASRNAVPSKVAAMQALGADVRLVSGGYHEAEVAGREFAEQEGQTWVSPYNDELIIAGQGTLGLEIMKQLDERPVKAIFVPAGGGGLVAGIGAALAGRAQRPRLIAVQPAASPFLYGLYSRGSQAGLEDQPTLADGLAGAVEEGSITLPLIREVVDEMLLVSEDQIAEAIAHAWFRYGERIEGAAAAALAAAWEVSADLRPAAVVISGGNIEPTLHVEICEHYRGAFAGEGEA